MDSYKAMDSFVAVIGDIRNSRYLNNRKEIQDHLRCILEKVNGKYAKDIASQFLITLGDEFQGLLLDGKNILNLINEIKMEMYPVKIRFGVGIGMITTDIYAEKALGADGPGYYRAREAVVELKEREKRNRSVPADICIRLEKEDHEKELLLNTVFNLLYVVENSWTERQREIIWDMLMHGDGQKNTAVRLSVSQPTIQKALASGNYYTYENALKNAENILGEKV